MKCSKCKKMALENVEYAGKSYCENHFLELMEKRIRKNIRTRKLIDINEKYSLIEDGSTELEITDYFLKKIFQGRLKFIKEKKQVVSYKSIIPTNLDEQALLFLNKFLKNKSEKNEKKMKTSIKPLEVITQKEIEILCKILNIEFIPRVKRDILEELDNKYPGTKFSLFQSKMNLDKK